jgi:hypothetical protein
VLSRYPNQEELRDLSLKQHKRPPCSAGIGEIEERTVENTPRMTPLEPIMEGTFSGGSQAPRTAGEFMGRRNMKQELRKKNNFFIKSPDNITVGNY